MSRKITKGELIKKFNKLYRELGRVPNRDEMGNREPVKRLCGGYNNFLREMGHMPNYLRTKEDYVKYIKKLREEINRIPSQNDLQNRGIYLKSIYDIFGSYNDLLIAAGLNAREKIYTDKTKEELLSNYIKLSNELGRWATTRELESIDIYENRFGNIIEVRKLVVDDERLKIDDKTIEESYRKYTDEEIKDYVKEAIKIYGYSIKKAEFMEYLKEVKGPSINTITKRHKSTSFREMIDMYKD